MVNSEIKNGTLVIYVDGKIDSSNSPEFQAKTDEIISGFAGNDVILDIDKLEYISSAGLRVILKIRKAKENLKIANASSDVYEVLEMTGFTEMIPVEKAYRKFSVEGCEVIGQGANGKVYRIDRDTIIKVYFNPDCLSDIQRERDLARKAFVLGVPTAIPYDVVRVGETYGSVFELLNASPLNIIVDKDPSKFEDCVEMSVDLLKKIHGTEVKPGDMPNMKEVVVGWVKFLKDYLDGSKWEKLNRLVNEVPEDLHMMHGDYHMKNVMLQNGEALLIDMDTLAYGNPVFEFASVFNAYKGFSALDESISRSFLGLDHDVALKIWDRTLELYFDTKDPAKLEEIENKAAILGYTRLMRRLIRRKGLETEEGRKTIEFYKNEIETRIEKVESLTF